jgi:hypothetical protein
MLIQCISTRDSHEDTIYGTGMWTFGEVKEVPDDLGKKMARHADVYVPSTSTGEAVAKVNLTPVHTGEPLQEIYDNLFNMTDEQLREFIKSKYNVPASKRQYPTVDSVRAFARQLVDQYGAPV